MMLRSSPSICSSFWRSVARLRMSALARRPLQRSLSQRLRRLAPSAAAGSHTGYARSAPEATRSRLRKSQVQPLIRRQSRASATADVDQAASRRVRLSCRSGRPATRLAASGWSRPRPPTGGRRRTLSCRLYTPAVASFRRAAGPAGLGGPGGADRVERVGFAWRRRSCRSDRSTSTTRTPCGCRPASPRGGQPTSKQTPPTSRAADSPSDAEPDDPYCRGVGRRGWRPERCGARLGRQCCGRQAD